MKAILKTLNEAYSHLNGHTFRVVDLSSLSITLEVEYESNADFIHTDILIVDLDMEIRSIESKVSDFQKGLVENKSQSYYLNLRRSLGNLHSYCIANGFEFNVD